MIAGIGMGLFFAPVANVVLSAVRPEEEGKASGPTTRSASWAACSASRCSPRCSRLAAATQPESIRRRDGRGRSYIGAGGGRARLLAAFAIPSRRAAKKADATTVEPVSRTRPRVDTSHAIGPAAAAPDERGGRPESHDHTCQPPTHELAAVTPAAATAHS